MATRVQAARQLTDSRITRIEGGLLLAWYIAYTGYLVISMMA